MVVFWQTLLVSIKLKLFLKTDMANDSNEKIKWVCFWNLIDFH